MKKMFLVMIALLAISVPAFAAQFLVNGNFETDAAAPADPLAAITGWSQFKAISNMTDITSIKGGTTFGAYSDGSYAGTPATYLMAPINSTKDAYISLRGGDTNGAEGGIYQEVSLQPGTYTLTGMVSTLNHNITGASNYYLWEIGIIAGVWGNPSVPLYGGSGQRVPEYNGAGQNFGIWGAKNVQTGGAVALTSLGFMSSRTNVITVTSAGTYTVYVMLGVNCGQNPTNKTRFKLRVDDLSLAGTPIPEPGSLLALGTGLIGLVGIIRRKR